MEAVVFLLNDVGNFAPSLNERDKTDIRDRRVEGSNYSQMTMKKNERQLRSRINENLVPFLNLLKAQQANALILTK